MKVGLILECTREGPDEKVCEYLVKRLQPGTEVVSVTLDNKPKLIAGCGETAAELLRSSCQRVIIVWDLYPPWRPLGEKPCRLEERQAIFRSLEKAGVTSKVYLVCIREELEAWLLADRRAIAAAITKLTGHEPTLSDIKNPESVKNPKLRLDKIFRQHTHRAYQAHSHAFKIVQELPDFTKIKRCPTFKRFALRATDIEL